MDGPWALPPAEGFLGLLIRAAFAARSLEVPRATITTSSTYTLACLAAEGSFLIVHPEAMLRAPSVHPFLTALPVELQHVLNPIGLLRLRTARPAPSRSCSRRRFAT